MTTRRTASAATRTLTALVAALVCASVAYRLMHERNLEHTSLVFIGIPAITALALLTIQPRSTSGTIVKVIAIGLCLSGVVFGEAVVCMVMASPLFFLVGILGGKLFGRDPERLDENTGVPTRWKHGIILLAPFYLEGVLPHYEMSRDESVTVSRIVPASADAVRASLAAPMRFDAPLPAFLRLGFPVPGRTDGAGLAVGDRRSVELRHGGHHPGTLTLAVTSTAPTAVGFTAVSDDSYLTHWLSWRSADVQWLEIAPGRTRVTWTLRYRRRLDPAFYFAPLERYGVSLAAGYLTETLATPRER